MYEKPPTEAKPPAAIALAQAMKEAENAMSRKNAHGALKHEDVEELMILRCASKALEEAGGDVGSAITRLRRRIDGNELPKPETYEGAVKWLEHLESKP